MATPVTGLDIDAMRKIASFRIGDLGLDVHQALRFEVRDLALAGDDRDRAGNLLGVDGALNNLVDALKPLGGKADFLRFADGNDRRRRNRHQRQQDQDGDQASGSPTDEHVLVAQDFSPAVMGGLHRRSLTEGRQERDLETARRRMGTEETEGTEETDVKRRNEETEPVTWYAFAPSLRCSVAPC